MSLHIDVDQARLLPHLRPGALIDQQAAVFRSEHHRATVASIDTSTPRARSNDGLMVDPRDLRGIPIVGRNVGGVSPGTQPERAAISKISREEDRAA